MSLSFKLIPFLFCLLLKIAFSQTSVGVLGDIEGNFKRFQDFIDNSETLYINNSGQVDLFPGKSFVFLGDAIDRGDGSIRFIEAMNSLKAKYPDRVKIILGNRDLNKLKIYHFLSSLEKGIFLPSEIYIYEYLLQDLHGISDSTKPSHENIIKILTEKSKPYERLKSILKGFNAKSAFDYHKQELKLLNKQKQVSNSYVYDDYMKSLEPNGRLKRFINNGELITSIDGNLFTHGAITELNHGIVPGLKKRISNTKEWIESLNKWFKDSVSEWERNPSNTLLLDNYHKPNLISMKNDKSVVYGRYSDNDGNPRGLTKKFISKLKESGFYRVFVGHTPTGDFPTLIKQKGFELILTDSSHANFNSASKILVNGKSLKVNTYDSLNNQNIYFDTEIDNTSKVFGRKNIKNKRVVGRVKETGRFLLSHINGLKRNYITYYSEVEQESLSNSKLIPLDLSYPNTSKCELIFFGVK